MGKKTPWIVLLFLCGYFLAACRAGTGDQVADVSPDPAPSATTTPGPTHTPIIQSSILLIDRLVGWESVSQEIEAELASIATARDWQFQSLAEIPQTVLPRGTALVIAVGGEAGDVSALMDASGDTMFILIAVEGAQASEGVAVIGPEGIRADKVAFISGYISAMVTPDWRVGMIGMGQTGEGLAALASFQNGAAFFCGLCRPAYPPFESYPASVSLRRGDAEDFRTGVEELSDRAVKTIALTHEISVDTVNDVMTGRSSYPGFWLGPTQPPDALRAYWLASISPDPARQIESVIEQLEAGASDILLPMPMRLHNINAEILTEGKLRLIDDLLKDLEQGVVDTAIDPFTGVER